MKGAVVELWRIQTTKFDLAELKAKVADFSHLSLGRETEINVGAVMESLQSSNQRNYDLFLWR